MKTLMVEMLLPPAVRSMSARCDVPRAPLFDAERAAVADAVAQRRSEFATARWCARGAMRALGVPATAVASGPAGEPLWPAGVVGSITHCSGYRASAVGRSGDVRSIGIDAEPDAPLPPGVLATITAPGDHAEPAGVCADRLLFSAKEAAFKAWFPLTRLSVGFDDVVVRVDAAGFDAHVLGGGRAAARLRGRWAVAGGIIGTAVVVPR